MTGPIEVSESDVRIRDVLAAPGPEGEEAVVSWPRPPLHSDCPDCGWRWFHGHAEDCPTRRQVGNGCVRCGRYGPDHVGEHVSTWPGGAARQRSRVRREEEERWPTRSRRETSSPVRGVYAEE